MPITKSAAKALRQSRKRSTKNARLKETVRNILKLARRFAQENQKEKLRELLPKAFKTIDKAVKTGILKKNTAARRKSYLARFLKRIRHTPQEMKVFSVDKD